MNDFYSNIALQTLRNFNLSVVISLNDEEWDIFVYLFPTVVHYYKRNGIEVILSIEETIETETIIAYIKRFPMVDWRVLKCPTNNFAQRINIGVRQSTKEYILLMMPNWEFKNDVIYDLRKNFNYYPDHYAIGRIVDNKQGALMVRKENFERLGGLDETISNSMMNFYNLEYRMELAGMRKLFYPDALLTHHDILSSKSNSLKNEMYRVLLPNEPTINREKWGESGFVILFDWRNNPFREEQCKDYLSSFLNYYIPNSTLFSQNYRLIALIPAHQESERIADCLRSVEKHCDGIIVLDDESADNTYEMIESKKLLLKVKKKRTEFNDKENRNILLDLAYFFRSEWFIFIDADERFEERFVDLSEVMQLPVDVVGVWIANLWNSMETFRTDMIDSHPISKNGLWFRWRMFRNKGRMRIINSDKLHFASVQYILNSCISQTLILHLGYLTQESRTMKYSFYQKEDERVLIDYEDILNSEVSIANLSMIEKNFLY